MAQTLRNAFGLFFRCPFSSDLIAKRFEFAVCHLFNIHIRIIKYVSVWMRNYPFWAPSRLFRVCSHTLL